MNGLGYINGVRILLGEQLESGPKADGGLGGENFIAESLLGNDCIHVRDSMNMMKLARMRSNERVRN
jgi:hypothetical protein